jgi:UDP-N-acetylmuramyl pentapeptide phosphotransferase/UDP-N-acetylglucosamine-1-phosphate transferase
MGGLMIMSGLLVSTLLWANSFQRLCLVGAAGDRPASA